MSPRVVILAAGEGRRLRPHTADRPKALVPLLGRPLLDYQLEALASAGLDDVTLVTGYRSEALSGVRCARVHNPGYAVTNMVASLMCARSLLDGSRDLLVAYSDIVYEARLPAALAAAPAPLATCVDTDWLRLWKVRMDDPLADAETLRLDGEGRILEIGSRPSSYEEIQGQYVGLTLVRREAQEAAVRCYDALPSEARARLDFTGLLQRLVDSGTPVVAVPAAGGWLELDTVSDLERYERLARAGALASFWDPPKARGRR